jgi:integrase
MVNPLPPLDAMDSLWKRVLPGEVYKTQAYGRAIVTACDKANVPRWHPHQLPHNAAIWLRKEFGLDVARVVLSHRSPSITEQYPRSTLAKRKTSLGGLADTLTARLATYTRSM